MFDISFKISEGYSDNNQDQRNNLGQPAVLRETKLITWVLIIS